MAKKIIIAFFLLILLAGIGFWSAFIKEEIVKDKNLLTLCLSKDIITVENAQSAKFIANIKCVVLKDTLKIEVKTTSVFNPFAHRNGDYAFYQIDVKPTIKYILIGNSVIPLTGIRKCLIPI